MVPWRFLLPGQYWSVHRLPEGWNGGVNEGYNDSLQGRFPCKIQDNIGLSGIPAEKKMPGCMYGFGRYSSEPLAVV